MYVFPDHVGALDEKKIWDVQTRGRIGIKLPQDGFSAVAEWLR
jgi:hypothetical protein